MRCWDAKDGRHLFASSVKGASSAPAAFDATGDRVFIGGDSPALRLVECATGTTVAAWKQGGPVTGVLPLIDGLPVYKPLFQGLVLMAAICLGSVRLLQIRNRLDLYG